MTVLLPLHGLGAGCVHLVSLVDSAAEVALPLRAFADTATLALEREWLRA